MCVVIEIYLDSEYVWFFVLKFELVFDYFVVKEMEIGCYYFKCDNYVVLINWFCVVVEDFEIMIYMLEVLYCLVEVYFFFGLIDEV